MTDRALALVVDDEELIRRMVGEQLDELGYQVLLAETADNAYEIMQSRRNVILLITDVRMPGRLNGFDLIEKVLLSWPGVRAIVMSGYTGAATTRLDLAHRYLRKPFTMSFLEKHVREVMAIEPVISLSTLERRPY